MRLIAMKKDKTGDRQRDMAKGFVEAGLLSKQVLETVLR